MGPPACLTSPHFIALTFRKPGDAWVVAILGTPTSWLPPMQGPLARRSDGSKEAVLESPRLIPSCRLDKGAAAPPWPAGSPQRAPGTAWRRYAVVSVNVPIRDLLLMDSWSPAHFVLHPPAPAGDGPPTLRKFEGAVVRLGARMEIVMMHLAVRSAFPPGGLRAVPS